MECTYQYDGSSGDILQAARLQRLNNYRLKPVGLVATESRLK
jgi:hypothetical protein